MVDVQVGAGVGNGLGCVADDVPRLGESIRLAGGLHGVDGFQWRLQLRVKVVADDALPPEGQDADHGLVVLQLGDLADAAKPLAVGHEPVQRGGAHHEQDDDGAAVSLRLAALAVQIVQAEAGIQQALEIVLPQATCDLANAAFQQVQGALNGLPVSPYLVSRLAVMALRLSPLSPIMSGIRWAWLSPAQRQLALRWGCSGPGTQTPLSWLIMSAELDQGARRAADILPPDHRRHR